MGLLSYRRLQALLVIVACALSGPGCGPAAAPHADTSADDSALVGAWRSKISFSGGPLAGMKDLEFLHAYNAGGTMTESSNYDEAANSSPPAYGVWKKVGTRRFETKYVFFTTRSPGPADGAPTATDWWPDGHGELTETITLSEDGRTYSSAIRLAIFDKAGAPVGAIAEGTGAATRIEL